MVLLRGYSPGDNSDSHVIKSVIACMRDGVVACFFIAPDGTMSMQVTTVASETFEMNSKGAVLMFSSEIHLKKEVVEESTGITPRYIFCCYIVVPYVDIKLNDFFLKNIKLMEHRHNPFLQLMLHVNQDVTFVWIHWKHQESISSFLDTLHGNNIGQPQRLLYHGTKTYLHIVILVIHGLQKFEVFGVESQF